MFYQAFFEQYSQKISTRHFFICTISHTQGGLLTTALFHLGMSGAALLKMWKPGPIPACTASRARFSTTPKQGRSNPHIPMLLLPNPH
jgi:hypothetical protein